MPWFSRIGKLEWLNLVLEDVWEGDKTAFASLDGSDVLGHIAIRREAVYIWEPFSGVELRGVLHEALFVGLVAEGEGGMGDVFGRVVVYCCSTDSLIL